MITLQKSRVKGRYKLIRTAVKILIIDDDEDDTLILSDALKNVAPKASYEIIRTHGPWKSHIQTEETTPDIIFIDAFPLIGKACLRQLNALNQSQAIKIVVYTDESRPSEIDAFMQMGANRIILKTGNYSELKTLLAALMDE
jgi:DNA-binding NarL/FixJ family response regulator